MFLCLEGALEGFTLADIVAVHILHPVAGVVLVTFEQSIEFLKNRNRAI